MNKKLLLLTGLVLIVAGVLVFLPDSKELQPGEVVQKGNIEISDSLIYQHNIVYPKIFSRSPHVEIKLTKGSGYLEIVEQRVDGFVFKSSNLGYSVADGAHVEWTATGFTSKN